jgi:hydrogenase maturation factor
MAKECVNLIIKKIENPAYKAKIKIVSGHMVIRESVKNISK